MKGVRTTIFPAKDDNDVVRPCWSTRGMCRTEAGMARFSAMPTTRRAPRYTRPPVATTMPMAARPPPPPSPLLPPGGAADSAGREGGPPAWTDVVDVLIDPPADATGRLGAGAVHRRTSTATVDESRAGGVPQARRAPRGASAGGDAARRTSATSASVKVRSGAQNRSR